MAVYEIGIVKARWTIGHLDLGLKKYMRWYGLRSCLDFVGHGGSDESREWAKGREKLSRIGIGVV